MTPKITAISSPIVAEHMLNYFLVDILTMASLVIKRAHVFIISSFVFLNGQISAKTNNYVFRVVIQSSRQFRLVA